MWRPLLVASDVDGTLLDPGARVSQRTRVAVHRVVAAGVPFVLVTGRPPRWIPPIVEQLGHAGPTVCANGAVHYDAATDRVGHTVTLDPGQLRAAAEVVASALPGAKLAVELPTDGFAVSSSAVNCTAVNSDGQFLAEAGYTHPWPDGESEIAPRDLLLGRPAIKLLVRQADASSDLMVAAVAELLGVQSTAPLELTYSTGYGLIELSAPGVTKGAGLARLAAELGIAPADVLAVGDMPNDLSMLRWAGHGVAMANSHPTVLAAADEITAGNSEDGVACLLERWF